MFHCMPCFYWLNTFGVADQWNIESQASQDVCLFIKEARGDTKLHQTRRQTRVHGQSPMNVTISYDFAAEIIGFNGCGPGSINRTKYYMWCIQVPKFRRTIGKFAFIFHYTLSNLILAMNICFLFMSHIQLKSVELILSANQFIFCFLSLIAVLA